MLRRVDVKSNVQDRRDLALAMGLDPLFLLEGDKFIYVEGDSDKHVVSKWLGLNFSQSELTTVRIQEIGGCGKLNQEFLKPLFDHFQSRILFILDSDGNSDIESFGFENKRFSNWCKEHNVKNVFFTKRRELENYIGHEAIAKVLKIHPDTIKPLNENKWFDLKAAVKKIKGAYDEKRVTIGAFDELTDNEKRDLFKDDNDELKQLVASFIAS